MNMNMLAIQLFAAWACLFLAAPCPAQELAKEEKDALFIDRLNIQPSVEASARDKGRTLELNRVAESLDTQFITAINATRQFQIVERKRVADLQEEQAFAAVNVDAGDKNTAQLMKIAGAKYAFLPQIDGFEDRSETQQYQQIGRSSMGRKLFLSAVVQVVDSTTGKLMPDAPSIQLNKTEVVEMSRMGGGAAGSDQILVELAKEMAAKLSQGVLNLLRPAKVLTVTGKQLMINRGTEAGFNNGDMLEIYATENVVDEDTGETFRNEIPVGQARIIRGDGRQSFATIEGDDLGISKGCVAKTIQAARPEPVQAPLPASAPGASFDAPPAQVEDDVTPGSGEKPLKFDN